jgi:hypothetical protein
MKDEGGGRKRINSTQLKKKKKKGGRKVKNQLNSTGDRLLLPREGGRARNEYHVSQYHVKSWDFVTI